MNTKGGPISEVVIDGRKFQVMPDSDPDLAVGGRKANVTKPAQGTSKIDFETLPGSIKGLTLILDQDRRDTEFLQSIVDGGELVDCSASNSVGTTWAGKQIITSEIAEKLKGSTIDIDLEGDQLNRV